jgi:outer membrane biosynthesis protein TonB
MLQRFLPALIISLIVHYLLLGTVPGFDLILKPRKRVVDIEIIESSVRELPPAPVQKTGSSAVNKNAEENEAKAPALTVPKIDIPDIKDTQELDVKVPELNVSRFENTSRLKPDEELLKELKSTSDDFQKANQPGEGIQSDVTGNQTDAKDFFVIKNLNRNRSLTTTPERPEFALTTDTTVRLGFKVDREGNTYSIALLNSTDSQIERLAIDFVKKLKFNAVLAEEPESAEIILNFRVR